MNEFERQQRANNEAFRQEAANRLAAQQQEQHRREMEQQERHWDGRRRAAQEGDGGPNTGGGQGMSPVVLFFGVMGALLGGIYRPAAMHWVFGAFFGFLIAGVAAGYMSESPRGRTILTIVGLLFLTLVVGFVLLVILMKDQQ